MTMAKSMCAFWLSVVFLDLCMVIAVGAGGVFALLVVKLQT